MPCAAVRRTCGILCTILNRGTISSGCARVALIRAKRRGGNSGEQPLARLSALKGGRQSAKKRSRLCPELRCRCRPCRSPPPRPLSWTSFSLASSRTTCSPTPVHQCRDETCGAPETVRSRHCAIARPGSHPTQLRASGDSKGSTF
jgi:hypothetical protein